MNFEELYRANYAFVWRTVCRMGVSERDADDACQKVFLTAYRRMSDFEGRSSFRTWLCGIALRVAADYRSLSGTRLELLEEAPKHSGVCEAPQLDAIEQKERLSELDAVLALLPIEQRTVLVLFELEEMSGEAIAELLNLPEGTVRSRLRLAREAFSRIVAARGRPLLRRVSGGGS